jgi:hypothetical protein
MTGITEHPILRDYRSEKPGILERSGLNPIRKLSVVWCREFPVEAAALPGWNLDLLAKVLEGIR